MDSRLLKRIDIPDDGEWHNLLMVQYVQGIREVYIDDELYHTFVNITPEQAILINSNKINRTNYQEFNINPLGVYSSSEYKVICGGEEDDD